MGGRRVNTKLSPFVYKVKGKKNYLLFDSLRGLIYNISPEGCPYELESQLIENELVIKTKGVIPFKFRPNIEIYKLKLVLKELQLRITGNCFFDCPECGEIGKCKKGATDISKDLLDIIANQVKYVEIQSLSIMGGNPLLKLEMVEYIKSKIIAKNYRIMCYSCKIEELKKEKEIIDKMGITFTDLICDIGNIAEENMSVNVMEFFFNQEYNPCWGSKIAIDSNGDIKACMWSGKIFGNVRETSISNLIFTHKFDEFWKITKDEIEVCKDCEFRYSCSDCRVIAEKESGSLHSKTLFCSYCPDTGEWL